MVSHLSMGNFGRTAVSPKSQPSQPSQPPWCHWKCVQQRIPPTELLSKSTSTASDRLMPGESKSRCLLVLAVNILRFSIQLCFLLGICLRRKQTHFWCNSTRIHHSPYLLLNIGGMERLQSQPPASPSLPHMPKPSQPGKFPQKSVTSPEKSTNIHGNPW